ncbi:hypothetical protein Ocin01_19911 [Orchesella cincta]|uniref:Uncharacterized protein n=1 Tax=Orchesella cincta TaxID=48709 RepID=A0A1D2M1H3_ORCCI|nr:hypothetical protein Ocin01_19911 [Orchesella cincta]
MTKLISKFKVIMKRGVTENYLDTKEFAIITSVGTIKRFRRMALTAESVEEFALLFTKMKKGTVMDSSTRLKWFAPRCVSAQYWIKYFSLNSMDVVNLRDDDNDESAKHRCSQRTNKRRNYFST